MSVKFGVSTEFPFSRCRACGQRVLWFAVVIMGEDDTYDFTEVGKPKVTFNQVGHENNPCYCPYCGEKKLWKEDS